MPTEPFQVFDYLHFARTDMNGAAHELCMSGVPELRADDLGPAPPEARGSSGSDVLARWKELVATRWGLPRDQLLPSLGASGGVFLTVAACATLARDGHGRRPVVAIERPAYGVFEAAARFIGAAVVHVDRPRSGGYAVDLDRVEAALRDDSADVFCLTNLQNPVGVAMTPGDLDALRELAHRYDAWIILDEVYRDFVPGPVGSDYRSGERIVCTSSMTKCYGMGAARCGWIAAPPEVIGRADHVVEILHGVDPVTVGDVACRALACADELLARGREAARRGRRVMDAWIESTPGVGWTPPAAGLTGLVHVEGLADSLGVARRLRDDLGVQVVPGGFFGEDDALRVSFGLPPARLQQALETLALGLSVLTR